VPASPEGQIAPTPQQSACLTRASWQQAIKNASTLASTGLAGKLAISDVPAPDYQYEVSVVNLDGNSRKLIGRGDSPSLSPDGTRIVYNGPMNNAPPDGLYITELASGNTMRLPGTARGDLGPIWSPDGTQIAFTRGPSTGPLNAPGPRNIVITGIDGSNSRQLTSSEIDSNYAMAWMPDGKHILYMRRERNGASVHTIDIQTGEVDFIL